MNGTHTYTGGLKPLTREEIERQLLKNDIGFLKMRISENERKIAELEKEVEELKRRG